MGTTTALGFVLTFLVAIQHPATNRPCPGQPSSYHALWDAFSRGQLPTITSLAGTWVEIGRFQWHNQNNDVDCQGIKSHERPEWLMTFRDGVVDVDIAFVHRQSLSVTANAKRRWIAFEVDTDADTMHPYNCRITRRNMLVCVTGRREIGEALEFARSPKP